MAGEYGHCVKQGKVGKLYKGEYTSKDCLAASKVSKEEEEKGGKKNKYDWVPVPVGSHIKTTSSGKLAFLEGGAGNIECSANTDMGEITGPKSNVETTTFTGCKTSTFKEECFSEGEKGKATIVTYPDITTLIDNGEKGLSGGEPKPGEVWNEFTGSVESPFGKLLAHFFCLAGGGEVPFYVTGSLSGVFASKYLNKEEKTEEFTAGFGAAGEQDLITTYFTPEEVKGPSVQNAKDKIKGTEKVEIRS
jgi:hypothetical protein